MQMIWPTETLTAILNDLLIGLSNGGADTYDYACHSYFYSSDTPDASACLLILGRNDTNIPTAPFVSFAGNGAPVAAIRTGWMAISAFGPYGAEDGRFLIYGPHIAAFQGREGDPVGYVQAGIGYVAQLGAGLIGIGNPTNGVADEAAYNPNKLTAGARASLLPGTVDRLGVGGSADLVDGSDTVLATWTWPGRLAVPATTDTHVQVDPPAQPTVSAVASGTAAWLVFRNSVGAEMARADVGDGCYLGLDSLDVVEGDPMTWGVVRLHSGGP